IAQPGLEPVARRRLRGWRDRLAARRRGGPGSPVRQPPRHAARTRRRLARVSYPYRRRRAQLGHSVRLLRVGSQWPARRVGHRAARYDREGDRATRWLVIEQGLPGEFLLNLSAIPILDHYCHRLRRFSQSLDGDSLQRFFVETIDPAMMPHVA